MVYGIRIQKDSVYGIWYKDSEGFNIIWYMDIRIQKCFSIWYMV